MDSTMCSREYRRWLPFSSYVARRERDGTRDNADGKPETCVGCADMSGGRMGTLSLGLSSSVPCGAT
eukprot:5576129-Pyramimonas_sp.AAC.1